MISRTSKIIAPSVPQDSLIPCVPYAFISLSVGLLLPFYSFYFFSISASTATVHVYSPLRLLWWYLQFSQTVQSTLLGVITVASASLYSGMNLTPISFSSFILLLSSLCGPSDPDKITQRFPQLSASSDDFVFVQEVVFSKAWNFLSFCLFIVHAELSFIHLSIIFLIY